MTKKEYLQPAMTVTEIDLHLQILGSSVESVTTTGLNDDNLEKGDEPGNPWDDGMSRRYRAWEDEELLEAEEEDW